MNIVVLDGYTLSSGDLSWEELRRLGQVEIYDRTPEHLIPERVRDAEIVLTNKAPLRAAAIEQLPKLRYIGVMATGYDIIDLKKAADHGIVVTNVPGYGTDSVAQMVFALLLELCQQVGLHSQAVHNGEWASCEDWSFRRTPLVELSGKTMGIVGYGRIGEQVARIAAAFGMKVIALKRTKTTEVPFPRFEWADDLTELLRASDVVSLHCPLTPDTEGMINKNSLRQMKNSAFLINTARGKLIVEGDLSEALNDGLIAGAALDVLSVEPPAPTNILLTVKNCVITPHMSWATAEARSRVLDTTIANLKAFLSESPVNVVKARGA